MLSLISHFVIIQIIILKIFMMQIQIPLAQKTKIIKEEGNRMIFEVAGCYPGYGITLGNALRRVLLSSLPGAAITAIKIKGVQHEFSVLPFILEDVVEIMLNLKQIRFRMADDEKHKLTLKASGEKKVSAANIKVHTGVEILNQDCHIATLTNKKAELEMEIEVEKGLGYSSIEQRQKEKVEIGMIPVDAIFSPIRKVNFEVENMRVGDKTDYNRLIIDIETDGSITSKDALTTAASILLEQFSVFTEVEKISDKKEKKEKEIEKESDKKIEKEYEKENDITKMSIDELKFSTRTINVLTSNDIKTVAGLIRKNEDSVLNLEGMGEKGLKEIKKVLSKLGLELKQG